MSKLYIFPAVTASLGVWQLYRLQWKTDLIERIRNQPLAIRSFEPKQGNGNSASDFTVNEFELYKLQGTFAESLLIGPRPRASHEPPTRDDRALKTERNIGYIVISKFRTAFGDVLINRGWIPDSKKHLMSSVDENQESATKSHSWYSWLFGNDINVPSSDQTVRVVAQARNSEPKSMFVKNTANDWKWIDVEALSQQLKTLPFCFEVSASHQEGDSLSKLEENIWTRTTQREIKNDHLEYALTWFGLTAFMTVLIRTRKRSGRKVF
jgi:surfeit locus 1 family protein